MNSTVLHATSSHPRPYRCRSVLQCICPNCKSYVYQVWLIFYQPTKIYLGISEVFDRNLLRYAKNVKKDEERNADYWIGLQDSYNS